MRADSFHDHIQRDLIVPALGDDDVRVALRGLHKALVHGLDRREILIHDALEIAAAVARVAHDAAQDAHIGVSVHLYLNVPATAQSGMG